jgi:hypothetical protein
MATSGSRRRHALVTRVVEADDDATDPPRRQVMPATFSPRPVDERARDWLRKQLEWEAMLDALRGARRHEASAALPRQREPAAA